MYIILININFMALSRDSTVSLNFNFSFFWPVKIRSRIHAWLVYKHVTSTIFASFFGRCVLVCTFIVCSCVQPVGIKPYYWYNVISIIKYFRCEVRTKKGNSLNGNNMGFLTFTATFHIILLCTVVNFVQFNIQAQEIQIKKE